MVNTKQAKKRILQNNKKHIRNKSIISHHKTEVRKLLAMFHSSDDKIINDDTFKAQWHKVIKLTDSAVNKGVYHKNKAARIKSRLSLRIHKHMAMFSPSSDASPVSDVSSLPEDSTSPSGSSSTESES